MRPAVRPCSIHQRRIAVEERFDGGSIAGRRRTPDVGPSQPPVLPQHRMRLRVKRAVVVVRVVVAKASVADESVRQFLV